LKSGIALNLRVFVSIFGWRHEKISAGKLLNLMGKPLNLLGILLILTGILLIRIGYFP
jgi:predicted transporter